MKKLLILLPCYNDWNNLNILIPKINKVFKGLSINYKIIIINDASNIKLKLNFSRFKVGNNYILNLKKNVGSQIAIFSALSYLSKNNILGDVIILDSDGEDNPNFIKKLLIFANENKGSIIKINRIFRSDNKRDFCYAYSSSILKNFTNIKTLFTNRDKRYLGRSKMSLVNLFFHALRVITVFRYRVFFIFGLYFFIIYFSNYYLFIFLLITFFVFSSIIFTTLKINFLSNKNLYLNISNFKKLY